MDLRKRHCRRGFLRKHFAGFGLIVSCVLAFHTFTAAASTGVTALRDTSHDSCVTIAAATNNAAVAAGSCGASPAAQTYQFSQLSDGNYQIYTLSGTTYCLAYSGNVVVSTACAKVPSQEWTVQVVSTGMMVEAVGGTSCLADPADWNTSATTMQACNSAANNEIFQNTIITSGSAACGSTPSGGTVWVNGSAGSSTVSANAQQCPNGGTVTTTWTNQAQELCTNGTLTNTGKTQQVNVVTAAPVCNPPSNPNSAIGNITVLQASQPSQTAPPGATINVGANFSAVTPLNSAFSLVVYLTDSSGNTITSATDTLNEFDSKVPTTQWQGPINITRSLTVPSVANGTYNVLIALDNASNQALALSTGTGVTGDSQYRYAIGTLAVQASAPAPSLLAPQALNLSGFSSTFDDEFQMLDLSDGQVFNGSKWYTHNEQCCMQTTDGSGTYMYGMDDPVDPYSIAPGGGLDIRLQEINNNWSSGVITSVDNHGSGFSQQYGYFEMSAKFPTGVNTWPGFWMLNAASKASGAPQGEIDVLEYIANPSFINTIRTTLHDWSNNTAPDFTWNQVTNPSDGNFHSYGLLWTAQTMTFYFDRTVYFSCPTPTIMHQPYYMLVDLGIGSGYPTNNTPKVNDMVVRYVRAYALPSGQ